MWQVFVSFKNKLLVCGFNVRNKHIRAFKMFGYMIYNDFAHLTHIFIRTYTWQISNRLSCQIYTWNRVRIYNHLFDCLQRFWTVEIAIYLFTSNIFDELITPWMISNNFIQVINFISENEKVSIIFFKFIEVIYGW